jgi:hypothetical protein
MKDSLFLCSPTKIATIAKILSPMAYFSSAVREGFDLVE